MKTKYLIIPALLVVMLSSCSLFEDGPVGDREAYMVSGHVYYPDSLTLFPNVGIIVTDYHYYSISPGGAHLSEAEFSGHTDENGYFEITVPEGGKIEVNVLAYYQPESDTGEVMFHYHGNAHRKYTGKHGFEDLEIYTYIIEHPYRYPYCIPSYPFIGDSVRIVMWAPISRIDLYEGRDFMNKIFSMEYQEPDTSVMFFIPESLSLDKYYTTDIYVTDGGNASLPLHLREHEQGK